MSEYLQGLVLQSIGGFYYVETANGVYSCHARGRFRKQGISPLTGDQVHIQPHDDGEATLVEILLRRNSLVRPPVANVDTLVVVASMADPAPVPLLIDRMTALAVHKGILPAVVLNKADLADAETLAEAYRKAEIPVFCVSAVRGEGLEPLREFLRDKISVFTGNSGVGKSSLLNALEPKLELETGEISQKLGRGRHTTRSAVMYRLACGGRVADTPGFSSLETDRAGAERINKDELAGCFPEFEQHIGGCRFLSCAHFKEPDCAVREAVEQGMIAQSRYDSYTTMYAEVKDIPAWQQK